MKPSAYFDTMFQCPLCGSHYWGTSFVRQTRSGKTRIVRDIAKASGHCNGWQLNDGRTTRCDFVWNRSEDEWVFVPRDLTAKAVHVYERDFGVLEIRNHT